MLNNAKFRIGVDLGGTNIKVGIVNEQNEIIGRATLKTFAKRDWQLVAEDIVTTISTALMEAKITAEDCVGIGLGCPGAVDDEVGDVIYAPNLQWKNVPLGKEITRHFNLSFKISNDANCAALGEVIAGAAKNAKSAVMITLGTGVGGGVILDGKLMGSGIGGAELGHTTLIFGGEKCSCGREGCFEVYASATALIREGKRAVELHPDSLMAKMMEQEGKMSGRTPFAAAQAGDAVAKELVSTFIQHLGAGIVNMINIFRPEIVLISGGVCNEGKNLTVPLQEYVNKNVYAGGHLTVPTIARAELGNDAGIIGAANLITLEASL